MRLGAFAAVTSAIKLLGVLNDCALSLATTEGVAASAVGRLLHLITAGGDPTFGMNRRADALSST